MDPVDDLQRPRCAAMVVGDIGRRLRRSSTRRWISAAALPVATRPDYCRSLGDRPSVCRRSADRARVDLELAAVAVRALSGHCVIPVMAFCQRKNDRDREVLGRASNTTSPRSPGVWRRGRTRAVSSGRCVPVTSGSGGRNDQRNDRRLIAAHAGRDGGVGRVNAARNRSRARTESPEAQASRPTTPV